MTAQSARLHTQRGFTIIEVIIVLAIAGLIIMMIFLAIPALSRNSRNNQRKQDVSEILSAVSHYELSNSGAYPACGGLAPPCLTTLLKYSNSKLSYYNATGTSIVVTDLATSGSPTSGPSTDLDTLYIYNYRHCDPNTQGVAINTGSDYRDIVALYALETGGNPAPQCREL